MRVAPAVRALRTAAIARLVEVVTLVEGRVFTPPVPPTETVPYIVLASYSERYAGHYSQGGSLSGFDVRGVVRLTAGDAPLLALWEQVYAALQSVPLAVPGHDAVSGDLRFVTDYGDPADPSLRQFVARYEARTAVAA